MSIDFSKAPKDATHYYDDGGRKGILWYKVHDTTYQSAYTGEGWALKSKLPTFFDITPIPKKTFSKEDLQDGDVLHEEDGGVAVVFGERFIVKQDGYYTKWRCFPLTNLDSTFSCTGWTTSKITRQGEVVFEKEEEPQVEEMTLEQVCKELGKDIKIVKEG